MPSLTACYRQGRRRRPRRPCPRPASSAMAAAASGRPAHHCACTCRTGSATAPAACAWPAAEDWPGCGASGLAWTTPQRTASCATRPALSATSPCRHTRWPCQRRGPAALVRPGCSSHSGHADCCCPPASSAWRTGPVRGTQGTQPLPCATPPEGAATLRFPLCHKPAAPVQPPCQTFLQRPRRFHTLPAVAIPAAAAPGYASLPAHPQTEEDRLAIVTAVFALPISGSGGSGGLRGVLVGAVSRHRRGVLMPPRGGDGGPLQRLERASAKHAVAMRRNPRITDVPEPVLRQRGPRSPRPQQFQPPALFQAFASFVEGMISLQHGPHQGFGPAPPRAHMRRGGRDETIDHGGDLQTPSASQAQGPMCHGMHLLHGKSHDAPPVVASRRQHHSAVPADPIAGRSS